MKEREGGRRGRGEGYIGNNETEGISFYEEY